jgi:hypothetical protein
VQAGVHDQLWQKVVRRGTEIVGTGLWALGFGLLGPGTPVSRFVQCQKVRDPACLAKNARQGRGTLGVMVRINSDL